MLINLFLFILLVEKIGNRLIEYTIYDWMNNRLFLNIIDKGLARG